MPSVLYINYEYYPDFSGHAEYLRKVLPRIEASGYKPYVLSEKSSSAQSDHLVDGIHVKRIPQFEKSSLRALKQSLLIARHIFKDRRKYSLVHLNGHVDRYGIIMITCKVLRIPIIMHMVLLGADDPKSLRNSYKLMSVRMHLLKRLDGFIAISKKIYDSCLEEGFDPKKVHHIPQGVDTEVFSPVNLYEKESIRKEIGLKHDAKIAIFVGSVMERKGVDKLLQEWKIIQERNSSYMLIIAGKYSFPDNPELNEYSARQVGYVNQHNLNVLFLGVRNDVEKLMKASDVLVLPSKNEGFGNVIIEALSSGVPVVATPMNGVSSETVEQGFNGFVSDYDFLSRDIERILRDDKLRLTLSNNARESATRKFKIENIVARYVDLYDRLLK